VNTQNLSKHSAAILLGGTTWSHLMREINEAKLCDESYMRLTVRPTGAGFGYRVYLPL